MKHIFFLILIGITTITEAQELFPYTEPASNMPAKSMSLKLAAMYGRGVHGNKIGQRYAPEVMFGLSKKWMVHTNVTFSDMYESYMYFESVRAYAKYRFLSNDDVHKHFRMAAFAAAAYSRNHLLHNELNLLGDQSGVQAGVIATQLWNKLAISGTASLIEVLDESRNNKPQEYAYQSFNYSLSAGYLVFPKKYTEYNRSNLKLNFEVLDAHNLHWEYETYYIDFAPSMQLTFKSTSKLNLG